MLIFGLHEGIQQAVLICKKKQCISEDKAGSYRYLYSISDYQRLQEAPQKATQTDSSSEHSASAVPGE